MKLPKFYSVAQMWTWAVQTGVQGPCSVLKIVEINLCVEYRLCPGERPVSLGKLREVKANG